MQELGKEANEKRKNGDFVGALKIYESIENKDPYIISGIAHCYRKLGKPKDAILIIDNYKNQNSLVNIKEVKWLKTELVWSYADYYLNENYANKEDALKIAKTILDLGEEENEYLIKRIKKSLCIDEVIKKYPIELKAILDRIDGSKDGYIFTKLKIKSHLMKDTNVNSCIYFTLILSKLKVMLELKEYDEIIKICSIFGEIIENIHLERYKAKAINHLGEHKKAIDILNKASIKYGKQFYIYTDIGDIYNKIEDNENAIKNYYTSLSMAYEDKIMLKTLFKVCKILLDEEPKVAKKHIDLLVLIRQKSKWAIKTEEQELLEQLSEYGTNKDFNRLKKELKAIWNDRMNQGKEQYVGIINRILDNGNGFIEYNDKQQVFFKKDKKINFNTGDKVLFFIEDSYDKKKKSYSKIATQIKYKK